ncbi:hypothetical protein HELRODRAFT_88175 [Helobdella robusta]|uniref:Major facilitator superfamily (MFS) profile domain-containing protein n=1 Tax=Helobdella robusta TaxID=6412 RepID=T1G6Z4_HELRO|nr:hypothetical protein HELRODRAFT_88175 [Helobdella robusta]ESN93716.1 hypothetical protein HELRODRAFT_88175 [Helobdella robusta]
MSFIHVFRVFKKKKSHVLELDSGYNVKPYFDRYGYMVLFGSFVANLIIEGCFVSFGIIYNVLVEEFNVTRASAAWVGSVFQAIPFIFGPVSSIITNKFGCRRAAIIGGFIACLGWFLGSFMNSIALLVITFGLISGFGLSLVVIPSLVIVPFYFVERMSLAASIAIGGSGLGTIIYPPMTDYLIRTYTWRGAFQILAASFLHLVVCGALFRLPDSFGMGLVQTAFDLSILKNTVFTLFCIQSVFYYFAFDTPLMNIIALTQQCGVSSQKASWVLSTYGIANSFGQMFIGWLADLELFNNLFIYNFTTVVAGAATVLVAFGTTYTHFILYAITFGVFISSNYALCTAIIVEYVGMESLSNAFGITSLAEGTAILLGPPCGGYLFDLNGNYILTFTCAGLIIMLSGTVLLFVPCFNKCFNKNK